MSAATPTTTSPAAAPAAAPAVPATATAVQEDASTRTSAVTAQHAIAMSMIPSRESRGRNSLASDAERATALAARNRARGREAYRQREPSTRLTRSIDWFCKIAILPFLLLFILLVLVITTMFCGIPFLIFLLTTVMLYYCCTRNPIPPRLLFRALLAADQDQWNAQNHHNHHHNHHNHQNPHGPGASLYTEQEIKEALIRRELVETIVLKPPVVEGGGESSTTPTSTQASQAASQHRSQQASHPRLGSDILENRTVPNAAWLETQDGHLLYLFTAPLPSSDTADTDVDGYVDVDVDVVPSPTSSSASPSSSTPSPSSTNGVMTDTDSPRTSTTTTTAPSVSASSVNDNGTSTSTAVATSTLAPVPVPAFGMTIPRYLLPAVVEQEGIETDDDPGPDGANVNAESSPPVFFSSSDDQSNNESLPVNSSNEIMVGDRDVEAALSSSSSAAVMNSVSEGYSYDSGTKELEQIHVHDHHEDQHPPHGSTCDICLLTYEQGDIVAWSRNVDCPHYFHEDCITDWLHRKPTCCSCRRDYVVMPVPAETAKPLQALSDIDVDDLDAAPGATTTTTTTTAAAASVPGDEHV
jgi:hypothetical protein